MNGIEWEFVNQDLKESKNSQKKFLKMNQVEDALANIRNRQKYLKKLKLRYDL